jgi:hypothetical protein
MVVMVSLAGYFFGRDAINSQVGGQIASLSEKTLQIKFRK